MTSLAYAACFLALAALTGLAATGRVPWLARLPIIAATPILAIAVWWQLNQESGWPTGTNPANGSVFVASVVQSPTPTSKGAIYLWAQAPGATTPRAYRLPYDPQLEKQIASAAHASRSGQRVAIQTNKPAARAKGGASNTQNAGKRLRFYKLPPAGEQPKVGEAAPSS